MEASKSHSKMALLTFGDQQNGREHIFANYASYTATVSDFQNVSGNVFSFLVPSAQLIRNKSYKKPQAFKYVEIFMLTSHCCVYPYDAISRGCFFACLASYLFNATTSLFITEHKIVVCTNVSLLKNFLFLAVIATN
jgi:hypothetical protein